MAYMTRHMYLPALFEYSGDIATTVATKAELGIAATAEKALVTTLTEGINKISAAVDDLEAKNKAAPRSRTAPSRTTPTATTSSPQWRRCAPPSTRWRRSAARTTGPSPATTRCSSTCSGHRHQRCQRGEALRVGGASSRFVRVFPRLVKIDAFTMPLNASFFARRLSRKDLTRLGGANRVNPADMAQAETGGAIPSRPASECPP